MKRAGLASGQTVTYTFVATAPGTHALILQRNSGRYFRSRWGFTALSLSFQRAYPANCNTGYHALNLTSAQAALGLRRISTGSNCDFRASARCVTDHPGKSSLRPGIFLFQWAEMDSRIHKQALAQRDGEGPDA